MTCRGVCKSYSQLLVLTYEGDPAEIFPQRNVWKLHRQCITKSFEYQCNGSPWSQKATWFMGPRTTHHCQGSIDFDTVNTHCKLATLSPGQKPMLPSRRYFSMSPASRQRLQFYNEFIKWWPSANNFQCCPRAFGPRATLEIIGFGSPLDKASL